MLIVDLITLYTTASVLFIFLVYSHSIGVNNTKHYNMKVLNYIGYGQEEFHE